MTPQTFFLRVSTKKIWVFTQTQIFWVFWVWVLGFTQIFWVFWVWVLGVYPNPNPYFFGCECMVIEKTCYNKITLII